MMIEKGQFKMPQVPKLINEFNSRYKTTPSGNVQFGALKGYHDDCVIALVLGA